MTAMTDRLAVPAVTRLDAAGQDTAVYDTVFRARRAVMDGAEHAVEVGVRDGRIAIVAGLGTGLAGEQIVELAPDEVLIPGLVDSHVHVNEPGRTEWEGFDTATAAAAAGGVTTIIDMPLNSLPSTVTVEALQTKRAVARDQARVDVGFWGGAVPDHLDDLAAMHEAGVFGFKCFLADSGVEEFPPLNREQFVEAMTKTADLGALLIVHAEDEDVLAAAPKAGGTAYMSFLESRPAGAEDEAIALVIDTARRTGGAAHILHLSSASALGDIHAARADGVDLSVETCPHYLTLKAEEIPTGATQFKCCPPIRDIANQDALWSALAAGDIDYVVSDHSPCTPELKRFDSGDFGEAWGGIASLQIGLAAVWTAARARRHSLADVIGWMATAPADRVGLRHKGRIAEGVDADLVVFAPDADWHVQIGDLLHKNPVSAYAERDLTGVVRQTWLRGTRIEKDSPPTGRLIERGRR